MQPVILVILDGLGMSPISNGNAVIKAQTPFLDWAISNAPKTLLHASGAEVGLEWGEMGNSEVGHLNIGTGRIIMQDLPRINRAIEDGSFFNNEIMLGLVKTAQKNKSTLHLIGLASTGGVHSHLDHLYALLEFAKQNKLSKVALHLITDGRDTPQNAFDDDLRKIIAKIKELGVGEIATICGRYFAMDRDHRWERTEKAYQTMIDGNGRKSTTVMNALAEARNNKETDEFISPTVIVGHSGKPIHPIKENDVVIFYNFRPDRARQLSASLTMNEFTPFKRPIGPVKLFVSFTSYGQESTPQIKVAFFESPVKNQLAAILADSGISQFHLAETEKYAHVTYFFNGGIEKEFNKEERLLVPSPKVATYDQKPAMSAPEITQRFVARLKKNMPNFSVINYANPDMVGHTGHFAETVRAIEILDAELKKIYLEASSRSATLLITADHGNAEQLVNPETNEIDKEHTTNPVPFILIPPSLKYKEVVLTPGAEKTEQLKYASTVPTGVLADIAPTILDFMNLKKPVEMTGQSLRGLM